MIILKKVGEKKFEIKNPKKKSKNFSKKTFSINLLNIFGIESRKYRKIPRNTEKYRKFPKNTKNC
jgi:hypothetical protein